MGIMSPKVNAASNFVIPDSLTSIIININTAIYKLLRCDRTPERFGNTGELFVAWIMDIRSFTFRCIIEPGTLGMLTT